MATWAHKYLPQKMHWPLQHVLQLNWKILYALYDLCKKGGDVIVF